ncbi:GntR family transcriptional regulator [Pseudonocardia benzenivorans]|uniref:Transcriptional regulator, GntR family n=1 Tax=Pseudonocardia dioxanivorans (strain ATCC 55486 / DSM 44775 / JCM 13855 / CB1190) TaxID=675635 RepID=F4CUM5_PSEUX|nr:transcriptional regulator, GntR family [Pseudonocardia dioxanivorans CB1190]GJF03186.1 GntR family transcriptional regulator [Pseudonocardia sp. D17]
MICLVTEPEIPTHRTKSELALRVLRERIRSGQLEVGYRLQVDELAAELGMSPTPIREALRLLQADRLVHYEPHRGVVVARHSPERLSDVYAMRMALEPLATRLAIERMTDDQRGELQTIHESFLAAGRAGRGKRMAQLNSAWHLAIYEAAGSDMLRDFTARLWDVFPWRTNWAVEQRSPDSMREHSEVMAAVLAGDAQAGADAMLAHIQAGSASEQPELGEPRT